jgi:GPH family glycoside/pentoside/hexuronide:cation symporter
VILAIVCSIVGTAFNITPFILGASMVADVVEDSEDQTVGGPKACSSRARSSSRDAHSGVDIFVSSLMLAAAGFPDKAVPWHVPSATLDRLRLIYAVTYICFALGSAYIFTRFPCGRDEHEARLARLTCQPIG